jgi:alpha-mannosidase
MKMKIVLLTLLFPLLAAAQPLNRAAKYDVSKDRLLYLVGYSHLDTQWNWDYERSIDVDIKNIMTENFLLFEKYPDYVFNFAGSRRYQMMKEYYPDLFEKVKGYVKAGRWNVAGSQLEESEVNISSSESVIRQFLYGNNFFRREFGKTSQDCLLPDCFGFLANFPTIMNHCGLLGFSTSKLGWRSAVGFPFNVGVWNGVDGKSVIAALNPTSYTGGVVQRLDLDTMWNNRIEKNLKNYGFAFDYKYYGVGDQGGAPREDDVRHAIGSMNNKDGKFRVLLTSSDQMFKDVTPEIRKKMPTYTGDLLLIEHSAGSMTSEAYMKRMNRKNEIMAGSAEQMASIANGLTGVNYPLENLTKSWDLVLGSQFHDILPGTSIPKAYEYSWNDEFVAAKGFEDVLKNSLSNISSKLNTQTKGRSVVVCNTVANNREDIVEAEMEFPKAPSGIKVIDSKGKVLPSQITEVNGNKVRFIFPANLPSMGSAVFDVQEAADPQQKSNLHVTENGLENAYYKLTLNKDGDIANVIDKKLKKELLKNPSRLEFLHEKPSIYPAWNMDWNDRQNQPIAYLNEDVKIKIVENGPVRVALSVTRKGRNSEITQIISLAEGEAGKRVEVKNKVDWQSTGVSLKASFPLTADNENATYCLGVGAIKRGTNNPKKFEVPSKGWFDLTDSSGKFGVSILEDCKYASDKPDHNTLRLTLLYTPETWNNHLENNSQDWGIHDFKYAIYSHSGDWSQSETPWQAEYLNKPLIAFETTKHNGSLGKETSFLNTNTHTVGLMALKKAETGDYFIVRVNELLGKDQKGISIKLPFAIEDAYEVNGQEQKIGAVKVEKNALDFDISHYTIRSFAVKFASQQSQDMKQSALSLPYDLDVMTFDRNRADCNTRDYSYPAELIPENVDCGGVRFKMGSTVDEEKNAVSCKKQVINIPSGDYNKIYILASATKDTTGTFDIDGNKTTINISNWTGYVGQYYNRVFDYKGLKNQDDIFDMYRDSQIKFPKDLKVLTLTEPYLKPDNIALFTSHLHKGYTSANKSYHYGYMFYYELDLPKNAKALTLPNNNSIRVYAVTAVQKSGDDIKLLQPLTDDFKDNKPFVFRREGIYGKGNQ